MTTTQYDRAPGDTPAPPELESGAPAGVLIYTIGLFLAVVLTATSFWVANTSLLWPPGVALGLAVLARHYSSSHCPQQYYRYLPYHWPLEQSPLSVPGYH